MPLGCLCPVPGMHRPGGAVASRYLAPHDAICIFPFVVIVWYLFCPNLSPTFSKSWGRFEVLGARALVMSITDSFTRIALVASLIACGQRHALVVPFRKGVRPAGAGITSRNGFRLQSV